MRILIADNHSTISELLAQYLELKSAEIFQRPLTATPVSTLASAIKIVQSSEDHNRPDFVFLDLDFEREGYRGIDTVNRFQSSNPYDIPVVIYTGIDLASRDGIRTIHECRDTYHILGVLSKSTDIQRLCNQIRLILDGDRYYPPEIPSDPPSTDDRWGLTDREWEIAVRMARGDKTYSMSLDLGMTEGWLAQRLCAIYRKMGVPSRLEAVIMMREKLHELGLEY
jgi:two-component system nitrate/nitrite response regulator NarL